MEIVWDILNGIKVHVVLLAVQLSFSLWSFVAPMLIHEAVNPLVFNTYRDLSASCVMIIVILILGYGPKDVDKCDYLLFFLLGFCSFINLMSTTYALEYLVGPGAMAPSNSSSSMYFALIALLVPVIASGLSMMKRLERVTFLKFLGLWFAAAGATVVIFYSHQYLPPFSSTAAADSSSTLIHLSHMSPTEASSTLAIGLVFAVTHSISLALLMVYQVPLVLKYTPLHVTTIYYTIGTLLSLLLIGITAIITAFDSSSSEQDSTGASVAMFTIQLHDFSFANGSTLFALLYATLLVALLPYNALSWSASYVPPSISTLYYNTLPLYTALGACIYMFFGLSQYAYNSNSSDSSSAGSSNSNNSKNNSGSSAAAEMYSLPLILGSLATILGIGMTIAGRYFEVEENHRNRILNNVSAIRKHMSHINVHTGFGSDEENENEDGDDDDDFGFGFDSGGLRFGEGLGDLSYSFQLQPSEQHLLSSLDLRNLDAYSTSTSTDNNHIEMSSNSITNNGGHECSFDSNSNSSIATTGTVSGSPIMPTASKTSNPLHMASVNSSQGAYTQVGIHGDDDDDDDDNGGYI